MSLQEKAQQAAVERAETPSVKAELARYRPSLAVALPPGFPGGVERFARIVTTAISKQPELAGCTPRSVIGAAMQAAQLGLTPNLMGQCWILPYRDKKTGFMEAQFQMGWKGFVDLAGRNGIQIRTDTICENDKHQVTYGLVTDLQHQKPFPGVDRGESIAWYAVAECAAWARPRFELLDRPAVERFRAQSKSPNSPAWTNWYDEMAMGKAVRVLCRTLHLSVDLGRALEADERRIDIDDVIDVEPIEAQHTPEATDPA